MVFIFHFLAQPIFFHFNFSLFLPQLSKEIHVLRYSNLDPRGFTSPIVTHDCIGVLLGHQPFLHGCHQPRSNTSHSSDQSPTMNQIYVCKAYNRISVAKERNWAATNGSQQLQKNQLHPFWPASNWKLEMVCIEPLTSFIHY